jgi:hypothetical protein
MWDGSLLEPAALEPAALEPAALDLAGRVVFQDVRDYLKARGWTSAVSRRDYAAIYRSPRGGEAEVIVPLDRALGDYAEAIRKVAERVASFESRTSAEVLRDLLHPRRDTLRFVLEDGTRPAATLTFGAGAALVAGARKALLAGACGALRPRKYHPRITLLEAEAYVLACRLGQAETGRFALTVDAPLETSAAGIAADSFGRRASEYLFSAVGTLADAIRKDDVASVLDVPDDRARLSANVCEAVLDMLPPDESADLRLQSSWSPLLPPSPAPSLVSLDRGMYAAIELIGYKLRPPSAPRAGVFVGTVLELLGSAGPSGAVEGEVTLAILCDGDSLKARASLGPRGYELAGQAHFSGRLVRFRAVLRRDPRRNRLEELAEFKLLEA